ncbi:HET-domain-containing protein [Lentinus brumalis]|uniref:HET-domain-containing protein n=1 Tax=Lentinus brumalis TaxID=2498619 RepID=A0A371CT56_9APHY|nr:HET-domain-containing protein [Polyporus brumalis]
MWLLSTDRAELKFFPSVQAAQFARFAILSHVWDETEQTFQETQALHAQCAHALTNSVYSINPFAREKANPLNPRDLSSAKIRESCKLAEQHGYKWIWIDACCIDKTSSSELSEAINSMFSYYSHADVCYAFLKDVPPDCALDGEESEFLNSDFCNSRWFQRGWTLQELLAPDCVIFLSSAWTVMGTKASLAQLVSEITLISRSVLLLEEGLWDMSVARRMSWAAGRQTTRPEDEAYCLLGIFDIHMPPLYGEGRRAFQRLQEAIMQKSIDSTLFAWSFGTKCSALLAPSPGAFACTGLSSFSPDTLYKIYDYYMTQQDKPSRQGRPSDATAYPTQLAGIPTFEITPYGIRARLPVMTTPKQVTIAGINFSLLRGRQSTSRTAFLRPCRGCGCA